MTKPLLWIKYEPPTIWQKIKVSIRRFLHLKNPSVLSGNTLSSSKDKKKLNSGIIDILAPTDDSHTFGEIMDVINKSKEWI